MMILRFLTASLAAVGRTVLLLVLLAAIFAAYRVATAGQIDNAATLTGKRDYLAEKRSHLLSSTAISRSFSTLPTISPTIPCRCTQSAAANPTPA
jgi:cbb3-type cytochrome oxidase subunit 3